MAPPINRRSGHSKRALYSTFIGYVLAIVGAALGFVLLIFSTRDADAFAGARSTATDLAAPAAQTAAAGRTGGQGLWATVSGYFHSASQYARLEREVAVARVRLAEAQAVGEENRKLKALLGLREGEVRPVATARLIGSTSSSARRFATLGVGSGQGVATGMPVRSPLGLVGRVLEVGNNSARVLLVTDAESVVPVRRAKDGIPAFATGRGDGTLQLRLISLGINPLKAGDAFVTSGAGGLYHPGIAIAVVTRLTPDGAIARPLSDPGTTEFVAVDPVWHEPRAAEAELAALPTPAATGKR